jgi:iron complex transport system substrate-binding protein
MSRRLALAVAALALSASVAPSAGLPRIVSMNVCTDQLLIAFADPEQILGLSRFSGEGFQPFAASEAHRFHVLSGGAEDVLVLKPDLVLASLFDKRSTRELLRDHGLRLAEFSVPRTMDEVRAQIRAMGELVGHPERAAAQIARLDNAIAQAREAASSRHYRVLPLSRRGWVEGRDSFINSLLAAAGLSNAAGELGLGTGGYASLEAILSLKPDLLVVSQAGDRAEDEGAAFLLHPALERFYPVQKRIVIPERLTECGGVLLADALDVLTKELKRVSK